LSAVRVLSVVVVLLLLPFAVPAGAHSLLLASSPAAGASVSAAPDRITLRFNNRIEKRLSRIRLVDAQGAARTLAVETTDEPAQELHAAAPALSPGEYRVEWQVLSTDGHVVNGAFAFRVIR
jgi:methionine-rich copper-binding protein CopC